MKLLNISRQLARRAKIKTNKVTIFVISELIDSRLGDTHTRMKFY